ncbi:MAG: ATP synthase F1 subunit delta [Bacteroidota bacterium]
MVEDRIGYRYAKSVYGLAEERKELDAVRNDMQLITETVAQSRDLYNLLQSPLVAASKKQAVIKGVFGEAVKTEMVQHLLEIVVRKGREQFIPNIARAFLELYDQDHKILRGTLTSAYEMDAKQIEEIKSIMQQKSGQTLEIETEVDEDLIGGFTLKVGDRLFDGSIAGSIRRARREFIK